MKSLKISKSQAVRDYLSSVHSSKRNPTKVSQALNEKGVSVTPAFVSYIKWKNKKKSRQRKPVKQEKSIDSNIDSLIFAKNLLNSVNGNLSLAKSSLETIAKLLKK